MMTPQEAIDFDNSDSVNAMKDTAKDVADKLVLKFEQQLSYAVTKYDKTVYVQTALPNGMEVSKSLEKMIIDMFRKSIGDWKEYLNILFREEYPRSWFSIYCEFDTENNCYKKAEQ